MSASATNKIPFLYTSVLYFLGFFLFLEWIYPVQQITDTSNLAIFIVYAAFCFIISMFQMKWWLSFLLKGLTMLFIIHTLFLPYTFLSKLWLQSFYIEFAFNIQALVQQNWYDMTALFRSFLFLLLIWLMSYLMYYWFVVMKRIFLFVLLTVIYVTILDTFTVYEADGSIVRTFIISFIAFGLANFFKVIDHESIRFAWLKKTSVWLVPLIAVVLFSTLVGYAAPKFAPKWPDPVPFLKSAAEGAGHSGAGSGIHKVGYGEDDSRLGGSFVQDYTPVFQAAAKEEHYWRIETKDVYTGKGWEPSKDPSYQEQQDGRIALETFDPGVETERHETIVEFQGNTNIEKLLYPYGIRQVEAESDTEFLLDENTGEIRTQANGKDVSLATYTITYDYPSFAIDQLRETTAEDPSDIKEKYTQLPASLPARVGELAKEITAAADNRYDKARAVESYFGRNGFTYQTNDIPVPKRGQDYVDQFLFDSQKGYCDNYSSSMVVMLRTLGIPARWAKGFTSGEKIADNIGDTDNTYDVYEVTSANAHSWVEVYFPGSGWVPFEPTQGFSNLTDFHVDVENLDENAQDEAVEAPSEQDKEKPEQEMQQEKEAENETATTSATADNSGFRVSWGYVGIGGVLLLLLAIAGYRLRFRFKTIILSIKFNRKTGAKTFQEAYHHLLKLLKHSGLAMEPGQTLREYAKRIDNRYGTHEMGMLTDHYERMLYNNKMEQSQTETKKLNELWKNLIKRISA
ncbi:hypothetical protein GCM10011409_19490 [Lentibacillus populi]|uniref:Transglutaminase-like domain-containing protein n=1 Tax=Lentibacillus populi TaxID=1827502 RepID=A0A9W5X5E2_9BACI|nr:transglutaminaseTgpA domain-containing protein [Lentibacillus populi]GGB42034.1 hypothetical protein GCM10011409_19490 [Lentibacillus populi]